MITQIGGSVARKLKGEMQTAFTDENIDYTVGLQVVDPFQGYVYENEEYFPDPQAVPFETQFFPDELAAGKWKKQKKWATKRDVKDVTDAVNNLHTKREAIKWRSGLKVNDALQLYMYDGKEYLPNKDSVPFTTGQTFADDLGLGRFDADMLLSEKNLGQQKILSKSSTTARSLEDRFSDIVNVKDFGAVGDGVTDDSDAVQRAVDYAYSLQTILTGQEAGAGVYTSTRCPVVFPQGDYYFGKSVNLGLFGSIQGVGRPYFRAAPRGSSTAGTHYIFNARSSADGGRGEGVWKYDFSNFICLKAKGFIDFDNGNRNQGEVYFRDFEVKGLETAINIHDAQSSKVVIENFMSDYCTHLLINERCDQVTLTKGWISQGKLTINWDATIHNKQGHMKISEVLGVPTDAHTAQNVAWVNNGDFNNQGKVEYTHTYLENFRAGGEYSGVSVLNNFVKFDDTYPVWANGFTIRNCELYSLDNRTTTGKSTIVRLFAIPNIMVVENNKGAIDTDTGVEWWSGSTVPSDNIPAFEWTKSKRNYVWDNPAMNLNFKVFPHRLSNTYTITQLFTDRIAYAAYKSNGGATFKTNYTATAGGVFDLIYVGNPNAPSSPHYRQPVVGKVLTYSVWDRSDSKYYVDLEFVELARPIKGDAPSPNALQAEVGAYHKTTGAYVTRVPFEQAQDYAIYVEIKGFAVGYENADGYLDFTVVNGLQ